MKWCGDMTEIPMRASCTWRFWICSPASCWPARRRSIRVRNWPAMRSRWLPRGGRTVIEGVIFHTDRGSTYTAKDFTKLCRRLGVVQSMGRVGSCFDNAASEAFFSTLEHEVLSRHHFRTRAEARAVVVPWCQDFYNVKRRHSSAALLAPDEYERIAAIQPDAA